MHSTASSRWSFIYGVNESCLNQASLSCLIFQEPTWGHYFYTFLQITKELSINILCAWKRCWLGTLPLPSSMCLWCRTARPSGWKRPATGISVSAVWWLDSIRTVHNFLLQLSAGNRGVKDHPHHTGRVPGPPLIMAANPLPGWGQWCRWSALSANYTECGFKSM